MDWVIEPIIEIVKLVGGPFVRYLKYQIKYNDLLQKFEQNKQRLRDRKHEIESKRGAQLEDALYHVATEGVKDWIKEAEEFIRKQGVVAEVNSWGYLSCCCRAVILEERTQELKKIYDRGDNYTRDCLVIEDHSKKFNYYVRNFNALKVKLQCEQADVGSKLNSQLGHWKIEMEQVKHWRGKVEEMLKGVKDIEDKIGGSHSQSSDSLVVLLGEKIQEMETMCNEGTQLPDCLVIEDQSKKFNYYVQKFNALKVKLQCVQADVGSKLNLQLGRRKIEMDQVKHWRGKVEEMLKGVKDIEDKIGGSHSHSSDSLVMLLGEKIQEMEGMCEEGSRLPDCLVIDGPSPPAVELPVSKLQGNQAVIKEILAYLIGKVVAKLGVCGMGGIGKTTIMKHVHNELLKQPKPKFKKIIWVTVSQNFDNYKLQGQIANRLKEQLEKEADEPTRAGELSQMLKEDKHKPYLLILDDVWSSFKLEDVGIPEPEPNVTDGCKLVLTTRLQEVARSMGFRRIQVETLPKEEALNLFLKQVGDTALSCQVGGSKKDLESTLKKIVAECDGLPLAIVTVAGSLKEIFDPQLWTAALNQLQDCKRNVAGPDDDDAFEKLKFSYDRLKNPQIQRCFLYCALYPEDYRILKEEIIEYWIDEGFIDEMDTRQLMKVEGYDILRKLEECSLLELIEDDDEDEYEYEGDCVRMHDLIRDMALHIKKSPLFLVEAGKALKELPEKVKCIEGVEKVSLMGNYIEEIPSSMASSTCTTLTTLLLSGNNLLTIPESIFEYLPELKVLDLSFNKELRNLPTSLSRLLKLTTLLLESTSVEKLPSLSGLGSLKKLNLRGTNIKEVPEGMGMLKNLKCLFIYHSDLGNYPEIDKIPDGVLSNLTNLQELIVDRSGIELKGDEVGRLKKLEVFHGRFPTVNDMRIFLESRPNRLSSYVIFVSSSDTSYWDDFTLERIYDDPEGLSRYKKIMLFCETSIVGENTLLPSVQFLFIDTCHNIRSLNDFSAIKDLTDLRSCLIQYCDGMECILSSWINNPVVQTLEYLDLRGLDKLDGLFEADVIAKSPPQPGTFSSLKEVAIYGCKKIKKLFPSWKLVQYLQSLESIYVHDCEEMEEIIGSDPKEEGEGGDIIKKLILSRLKKLSLELLPALKSICRRRAVMVCDSLEEIKISVCLRRIPFRLPPCLSLSWFDNLQPCTFLSVKKIKIQEFRRVKKLFPSWKFVEYLQSLEEIDVSRCKEMEEIIASDPEEEGEEGGDIIKKLILPKLKYLRLEHLPALKSICSTRAVIVCDSLESISIRNCKGLRRIPFRLPASLSLDELDNLDWVFEVELIAMSPTQPCTFSSLKQVQILACKRLKRLFPSLKFLEYLRSLVSIEVCWCDEMEEIIGSDLEEEGEGGGDIIKKLILPKLKYLKLLQLPALKSICSRRAVMVCEYIDICNCDGLRRIPLHLPPVDNAQPSPPFLKEIMLDSKEWWESLEWDQPNEKDVLRPVVRFRQF